MAEKHSEQIAPLERGEKKKSSRNWGKLAVEQKLGEAEGLRSPAAFTGSLGWAGCSRFFFFIYFYCFSLHSASISHPAPTFLGSEYYFYGAAMY